MAKAGKERYLLLQNEVPTLQAQASNIGTRVAREYSVPEEDLEFQYSESFWRGTYPIPVSYVELNMLTSISEVLQC